MSKPYKPPIYRNLKTGRYRPMTASEEIEAINTGQIYGQAPVPEPPPETKWQRMKRRWWAYITA